MNFNHQLFTSAMTTLVLAAAVSCKSDSEKPNVIVLLVDDAGYADFGFAGSEDIKTPNIDALANHGVVFSDAHVSASVCGPSRAGIMTGRYQQRFGYECNPPQDFTGVALDETTLADAMKKADYKTAAFGKWHLGDKPSYRPNQRGFDYFWGFLAGGRSYFPTTENDLKDWRHAIRENDTVVPFEGYLTDVLGDKAVDFIERNKKQPFFMYWAPNAVHTPMEASAEDMELFEGHPRQKLAAMTWALDRSVGKIVQKLKEENLFDNTLIFFLSDNGGAHNNQSSNYPLKGFKGNKYEGGHRVSFFMHWPSKIPEHLTFDGLSSSLDIFATATQVAGVDDLDKSLDGVNLIPYIVGEKDEEPHEQLFWRKDKMAAVRMGKYKMVRVERLGKRLYNLNVDLQEQNDLGTSNVAELKKLSAGMQKWEYEMMTPLWTEGQVWDTITWMIHEDLFNNRPVRVKNPNQLKQFLKK